MNRRKQREQIYAALNQGDYKNADTLLNKGLKQSPDNPELLFLHGAVKGALGRFDESVACLQHSIRLEPRNPEAHYNLGNSLVQIGRAGEAIAAYDAAIRLAPGFFPAHLMKANALSDLYRVDEAVACYQQALKLSPNSPEAWNNLARVYDQANRADEARQAYESGIVNVPNSPILLYQYCTFLVAQGEADSAIAKADDFTRRYGQHQEVAAARAKALERKGEFEQARASLEPWLTSEPIHESVLLTYAHFCHKLGDCERILAPFEQLLTTTTLPHEARINANFDMGKIMDRLGEYDQAFAYFKTANSLRQNNVQYSIQPVLDAFDTLIVNTQETGAPVDAGQSAGDVSPVFIIGMPRSGTSLVEQILSAHPGIFAQGETMLIPQLVKQLPELQAGICTQPITLAEETRLALRQTFYRQLPEVGEGCRIITDKYPENFRHLAFIKQILPEARFVHCTRHPLDTSLSCFFQNFRASYLYTCDLQTLGDYYQGYQRLMGHWQQIYADSIYTVRYEDMVNDNEKESRALLEWLGLEWDDRCLSFHDKKRHVNTASYNQVNEPIYTRSVHRYEHYRQYIQPLIEQLGEEG